MTGRAARRPRLPHAILVAGDPSEDAPSTLAAALDYAGYNVRRASTGDELLQDARGGDVSLIIAEVDFPCTDGGCAIEALKRAPALRGIPIVAYSSVARVVSETRALSSGADRFLADPTDLSGMFYIVGSLHNSNPPRPEGAGR
jgi:CheY-like chemotaxis protein